MVSATDDGNFDMKHAMAGRETMSHVGRRRRQFPAATDYPGEIAVVRHEISHVNNINLDHFHCQT